MKLNKITSALIGLGVISLAGVAQANSTVTIGGQVYQQVFITGSSAFRGNIFNAVNTAHSGAAQPAGTGGLFDAVPTYKTNDGSTPTGSTGNYTAYGTINGTRYCVCFSFTGSEAGLWALQHNAVGIPNAVAAGTLNGNPGFPNAVIPGTPNPTSFVDPNTGAFFSAQADLAMSDTSQAVSLSQTPALKDYGVVGAVTFEWLKAKDSSPSSTYNNLVNVTGPQMNILLGGLQVANFITGNPSDNTTAVFAVGRNKASGTHQNTMIDTQHGTTTLVDQWVAGDCTYNGSGQLALGTATTLTAAGGIKSVHNDGFDSGSGVATTMKVDCTGSQDIISDGSLLFNAPVILLGYLGCNDSRSATGPIVAGAVPLTLNGVAENDANIINGTYSFWGHEHLYSVANPPANGAIDTVAKALAGNVFIDSFTTAKNTPPNGAIHAAGGLGGNESDAAKLTTHSSAILPEAMKADKPQGSDSGYPSQI